MVRHTLTATTKVVLFGAGTGSNNTNVSSTSNGRLIENELRCRINYGSGTRSLGVILMSAVLRAAMLTVAASVSLFRISLVRHTEYIP